MPFRPTSACSGKTKCRARSIRTLPFFGTAKLDVPISARRGLLLASLPLLLWFAAGASYGIYPPQPQGTDELTQGIALYRRSQFPAACAHLEKALLSDPQSVTAWQYLGAAYARQLVPHDPSQRDSPTSARAREAFEHALTLDPRNKVALAGLGTIAFWLNDNAQAREFQLKRWNLDPNDPGSAVWVGLLDFGICYPRDLQLRQRLGIMDNKQPLPEGARAELEAQNRKFVEEGMKLLSKALAIEPGNVDAMILSCTMYAQKADLESDSEARANDLKAADRFAAEVPPAGAPTTVGEPLTMGTDRDFTAFLAPPELPRPLRRHPAPPPLLGSGSPPAATPLQSQKPFTQEQVKAMVRDGLANDMAAKAIAAQGIDFTPTDDLLRILQAAGASESFLQALRMAPHPMEPAQRAPSTADNGPIDPFQLVALLAADVPHERIAELVTHRGVTNSLHQWFATPEFPVARWLKSLGAGPDLIGTVSSATTFPNPDKALMMVHIKVAREEFLEKVKQNPGNHGARLGLVLVTIGEDQATAIGTLRDAVTLEPYDPWPHFMLAEVVADKDENTALAEYRRTLQLKPNYPWAHLEIAVLLLGKGDVEGAFSEYREEVRLNPQDVSVRYRFLGALLEVKRVDEAIAEANRQLRVYPNDARVHYWLGQALLKKGDQQGELQEFRRASELEPGNTEYQADYQRALKAPAQTTASTQGRLVVNPSDDPSPSPAANSPVDHYQMLSLLAAGVPDQRVIELVKQRGVTQQLHNQITNSQSPLAGWFQGLGASDDLISTLRSATTFSDPDPATLQDHKRKSEQELRDRMQQNPDNHAAHLALVMLANENRVAVGGRLQSAKLIFHPAPAYPPLAKAARIQGTVRMYAVIGTDGTVEELDAMSGHPLLIKAAMDAVEQWRYQPTLLNGVPVQVATEIDVNFTLGQ